MLTIQEIERINSLAPFDHSAWSGKGVTVTTAGQQEGRIEFVAKRIREVILQRYSLTELAAMSIADVGCYDGWILHELEDLPFQRMIGIEPRMRNVQKGQEVRQILGIKSRASFVVGGIGNLPKEQYDIVMCLGVFHHLDCISCALRELTSLTTRLLIIETIVLPSEHITEAVRRDVEMKDVVYKYISPMCGLTGQKYESSLYDGSAASTSVVSIASTETLLMYLDMLGYKTNVVATPDEFKRAMPKFARPSQETMIAATRGGNRNWSVIADHERKLAETVLPRPVVMQLLNNWRECEKLKAADPFAQEILKNIHYAPEDKVNLEYGKLLLSEGRIEEATKVLYSITQKLNADWRSCHRAFYLLSRPRAGANPQSRMQGIQEDEDGTPHLQE